MAELEKSKSSFWVTLLYILVVIVGLPGISLWYLNDGIEYRKEKLAELKDLGEIATFSAENFDADLWTKEDFKGNNVLLVSSQLACDENRNVTTKELYDKLISQKELKFVIVENEKLPCKDWKKNFDSAYFVKIDANNSKFIKQIETLIQDNGSNNYILLCDRNGKIRNRYDIGTRAGIESFITHVTVLLPPDK